MHKRVYKYYVCFFTFCTHTGQGFEEILNIHSITQLWGQPKVTFLNMDLTKQPRLALNYSVTQGGSDLPIIPALVSQISAVTDLCPARCRLSADIWETKGGWMDGWMGKPEKIFIFLLSTIKTL